MSAVGAVVPVARPRALGQAPHRRNHASCHGRQQTVLIPVSYGGAGHEGGIATKGYQPTSGSGVTIGAGVDLSQTNAQDLQDDGVPQSIIDYLKPWMVPVDEVLATVGRLGWPSLSTSNAQTLSQDVFNNIYSQVSGFFNAQTTKGFAFNTFPQGVQTAIVDAAYPNGVHLWQAASPYARAMWADALSGNWAAAESEFNSWQPPNVRYPQDGSQIQTDISLGLIPAKDTNGQCP